MNKMDIIISVSRLEVRFAEDKQIVSELTDFAENIYNDKIYEAAKNLGHLLEKIGESDGILNDITMLLIENGFAPTDVLDMTIEELNLSLSAFNCIARAGIKTVRELVSINHFAKIKNLSKKSLDEIVSKLEEVGIKLVEE